jgi:cold-inducible RNA-binding protein
MNQPQENGSRLYVGNLPYSVDDVELLQIFQENQLKVVKGYVIKDRETGNSKGFGFVEMGSPVEAQNAISKLDGYEVEGRYLRVSIANPKPPREASPGRPAPRPMPSQEQRRGRQGRSGHWDD